MTRCGECRFWWTLDSDDANKGDYRECQNPEVLGDKYEDGKWVNILEEGKLIQNPEVAEELLPTTSGFFFGSTEYDDWYLDHLRHTVKVLEEELKETKDGWYSYQASW